MKQRPLEVIVVSGLSGSGKSSALHTLEDAGYFPVDNLPGELFPHFLDLLRHRSRLSHLRKVALVMDAREKGFLENCENYFQILKRHRIPYHVLFFDTRDDILIRRFSETRRRHPLAPYDRVLIGIQKERKVLSPIRSFATHIIDTSHLNVHELRDKVLRLLKPRQRETGLPVNLISFGYRFGLPLEADLILDVRFLPNPYFINRLRPLSGRNPKVSRFVLSQKKTKTFLSLLKKMLVLLLKQYVHEGKATVTIGFGCTGGRHRSVVIVEQVARSLKLLKYPVKIQHRDISRGE